MKLKMAINSRFRDDLMNDRRNRQFLLGVNDNSDQAGFDSYLIIPLCWDVELWCWSWIYYDGQKVIQVKVDLKY